LRELQRRIKKNVEYKLILQQGKELYRVRRGPTITENSR